VFDVAIAERETQIEPNGVPDNRRRKLVARAIVRVTTPACLQDCSTADRPLQFSVGIDGGAGVTSFDPI
jgi:hypothetical protein